MGCLCSFACKSLGTALTNCREELGLFRIFSFKSDVRTTGYVAIYKLLKFFQKMQQINKFMFESDCVIYSVLLWNKM